MFLFVTSILNTRLQYDCIVHINMMWPTIKELSWRRLNVNNLTFTILCRKYMSKKTTFGNNKKKLHSIQDGTAWLFLITTEAAESI